MTQPAPEFGPELRQRQDVAESLGLTEADLHRDLPVQRVSCGVPYLLVPLANRETVDRAVSDAAAFRRLGSVVEGDLAIYLFAAASGGDETAYSRMFGPGLGIVEDPATGSATGPLGCYLVRHGVTYGEEARRIVVLQGVVMGRASRLHVTVSGTRDAITGVRVGGEAVLVGQGVISA